MERVVVRTSLSGAGRVAATALCVVALAACDGGFMLAEGPRGELWRARNVWEAQRPASYVYVVEQICFCVPVGPVRVEVVGMTATERVYVESGESVPEEVADAYPTVDGLFDVIEDALDQGAHSVVVTYGERGVPVEIAIDYRENVADEELGYRVLEQPSGA